MKLLLLFAIFQCSTGFSQNLILNKIGQFCVKYNYNYVSILNLPNLSLKTKKFFMKSNIRLRNISNFDDLVIQDFVIIFYYPNYNFDNWSSLSKRLIKKSMIGWFPTLLKLY